jgi:glycosyltransferase involved in cell wall biosynthesis
MQTIDARLVLAGEGDISESLRARVRALGLEQKVRFLGYVRPADLPAVMREAGVAVNLRERLGLNDYYSLGNKFFDYIHAELPQITMRFPEYVRVNAEHEVAVLIDDLGGETIRAAIARLLDTPGEYDRLRENCRAAREIYNWDRESERLLAFYERVFQEDAIER